MAEAAGPYWGIAPFQTTLRGELGSFFQKNDLNLRLVEAAFGRNPSKPPIFKWDEELKTASNHNKIWKTKNPQ